MLDFLGSAPRPPIGEKLTCEIELFGAGAPNDHPTPPICTDSARKIYCRYMVLRWVTHEYKTTQLGVHVHTERALHALFGTRLAWMAPSDEEAPC